eukprot:124280-Chlamydomonas_euryale.AAC.1
MESPGSPARCVSSQRTPACCASAVAAAARAVRPAVHPPRCAFPPQGQGSRAARTGADSGA